MVPADADEGGNYGFYAKTFATKQGIVSGNFADCNG